MKKRTLVVSLLLIAALALGIGYAGFTVDMIVNGDASMNATECQVVFTDAALSGTDGDVVGQIGLTTKGQNTISLSVSLTGFEKVNDKAVVNVTVKNPHDFDVELNTLVFTQDTNKVNEAGIQYITISHNFDEGREVKAGESYTFQITALCQATSADSVTQNFKLEFIADSSSQ